jgi:hypothetical protein
MSQWFGSLKARFKQFARGQSASRLRPSTRLGLEGLEERALPSGWPMVPALHSRTPLTWTAPSNNGANDVSLMIAGGFVEVFDNRLLVASKPLNRTSSITLTGGLNTVNDFVLAATPAGIPTTINLRTGDDWVNLGGSARSLQSLKGEVTVNGIGGDNGIVVYDTADTSQRSATIGSASITGLAPAPIEYSNVNWLNLFSGTGPNSYYTITGSPSEVGFSDNGAGDSVVISSALGRVYASSHAQDSVTFEGPASGSNSFTGAPTWDMLAGSGYSNVAFNFPSVRAYSFAAGDVANLDGASTGLNSFTGNPGYSQLYGQGYFIRVLNFETVNATSHSSLDTADLYGANSLSDFFRAAVDMADGGDPATGPFVSQASMSGPGYQINASGFANVTGHSNGSNVAEDFASLRDVNHNYSTDAQGNVFIHDHGFNVAAMGFPAGSVTTG